MTATPASVDARFRALLRARRRSAFGWRHAFSAELGYCCGPATMALQATQPRYAVTFYRLYGRDFPRDECERILEHLTACG